jgi:hypothetical protein
MSDKEPIFEACVIVAVIAIAAALLPYFIFR